MMRYVMLLLILPGCAASKNSEVAGFGDGQRAEMTGLVNAAVDAKLEATLEAKLQVNQDGGAGDGQRAAQSGIANFAIENEMSLALAAVLMVIIGLMAFDKLLSWSLQRMRIINDRMRMGPVKDG